MTIRIYTATGSNFAVFLATTFVNETEGGVQLLFRVAKRGLLEEELSGVPKVSQSAELWIQVGREALIMQSSQALSSSLHCHPRHIQIVAEKSLVILSKLNADAPNAPLVPNQLDPLALGVFLVRIGRDCSWVS